MSENTPGSIVVGVDGSQAARKALHWAVDEARHRRALVRVVHVWSFPYLGDVSASAPSDWGDFETGARALLDGIVAEEREANPDVRIEGVLEEGSAPAVLLELAKGADLLVVGAHGHGALQRVVLGSVSTHIVRHASCPVVVVRGRDEEHGHHRGRS